MSLRVRVALLVAGAALVAMTVAGVGTYLFARQQLRANVDDNLTDRAALVPALQGRVPGQRPGRTLIFGLEDTIVQTIEVRSSGVRVSTNRPDFQLEVDRRVDAVLADEAASARYDSEVSGVDLRVLVIDAGNRSAVMLALPLSDVNESLRRLRNVLLLTGIVGAGGAAAAGLVFADRSLRPVARLTTAAEQVAATQELDNAIPVGRDDELGRLATSFNEMLGALSESKEQQRRLVDDASHELRTPLTSLRTNVELLQRGDRLSPADRAEVLDAAVFELDELTDLVGELVDLASDRQREPEPIEIRLGSVVEPVVERHIRRTGADIRVTDDGSSVEADPTLLGRAVGNLIENALKYGPPTGPVDVIVVDGAVTVRDRGPGIPEADRERVFERFWRSDEARARPGSGLGLSIVRQVAQQSNGHVGIATPGDGRGGTTVTLTLPPVDGSGRLTETS